jgi:hypothetical protein
MPEEIFTSSVSWIGLIYILAKINKLHANYDQRYKRIKPGSGISYNL